MSSPLECQEARDSLAVSPADAQTRARHAQHRASCADCAAFAAELAKVADAARTLGSQPLDDITRARMAVSLNRRLDAISMQRSRRPLFLAAAAAAVLAVVISAALYRRGPHTQVALLPAAGLPPPFGLKVYQVVGTSPAGAFDSTILGQPLARIEVPAGRAVRATFGPAVRLTLQGPARVVVVERDRLRLDDGLLVGHYDHGSGGQLRVDSPGAVTKVIGTVFAIEAAEATSRVAVAHGIVEVEANGRITRVGAGGWFGGSSERVAKRLKSELAVLAPDVAKDGASAPTDGAAAETPPFNGGGAASEEEAISGASLSPPRQSPPALDRKQRIAMAPQGQTTPPRAPAPPAKRLAAPAVTPLTKQPAAPAMALAAEQPAAPAVAPAAEKPAAPAAIPETATKDAPARQKPASPPGSEEGAEALYAAAEDAMRAGASAKALSLLVELVRRHPRDPLVSASLYDLARLASQRKDRATALLQLNQLIARGCEPALCEPAHYLRCRLTLDENRSAGVRCLAEFRQTFPTSSHDAEVLAILIAGAHAAEDCTTARRLADEYLRRYPRGPFAAESRLRKERCGR